mgnify:FL=1
MDLQRDQIAAFACPQDRQAGRSECQPELIRQGGLVRRLAWQVLGGAALGLAVLGVVLPVLPTTPFAILAAFAFSRSVPSLQMRLENSRAFGPAIADWKARGAIAPRYKRIAMAMMCFAFGLSVAMSVPISILAVQAVCLIAAATFILSRPS